MDEQILIYAAILVAVIVLAIVGRSRFCMAHYPGILFPEHETHAD